MLPLTPRQRAALEDPRTRAAVFVEMEHPDRTLYLWSGSGIIEFRGREWFGCGLVAGISGIEGSTDPRVSQITFVLTGVPGDILGVADVDLKDRTAIVYRGLLRPDDSVVDAFWM